MACLFVLVCSGDFLQLRLEDIDTVVLDHVKLVRSSVMGRPERVRIYAGEDVGGTGTR